MAIIKVKRIVQEDFIIPDCFCSDEPVVCTKRAQGNDCYKQILWIECPYCHSASRAKAFDANSITSRYEATRIAAEDWCRLIERREK